MCPNGHPLSTIAFIAHAFGVQPEIDSILTTHSQDPPSEEEINEEPPFQTSIELFQEWSRRMPLHAHRVGPTRQNLADMAALGRLVFGIVAKEHARVCKREARIRRKCARYEEGMMEEWWEDKEWDDVRYVRRGRDGDEGNDAVSNESEERQTPTVSQAIRRQHSPDRPTIESLQERVRELKEQYARIQQLLDEYSQSLNELDRQHMEGIERQRQEWSVLQERRRIEEDEGRDYIERSDMLEGYPHEGPDDLFRHWPDEQGSESPVVERVTDLDWIDARVREAVLGSEYSAEIKGVIETLRGEQERWDRAVLLGAPGREERAERAELIEAPKEEEEEGKGGEKDERLDQQRAERMRKRMEALGMSPLSAVGFIERPRDEGERRDRPVVIEAPKEEEKDWNGGEKDEGLNPQRAERIRKRMEALGMSPLSAMGR